tara:strand:- start:641 stop:1105 length:465 start_codon:yes stop_codon:yes gene_type:complete
MEIDDIITELRSDKWIKKFTFQNQKEFGQFFTPNWLSQKINLMDPAVFHNPNKTIIDCAGCGIGELLVEVLIKRLKNGMDYLDAISTIYGVDIDPMAVDICRERLSLNQSNFFKICEKNIICADSTKIKNWKFDGTDPYKTGQDIHNETLFEIS